MNHITLFKTIQNNTKAYNWEVRTFMQHLNNRTDVASACSDAQMLLEFIERKQQDLNTLQAGE
jgi:hypothetical protein